MKNKYKDLLKKVKDSHEYWAEVFTLELIDNINELMEEKNINQKELAKKVGTSEAYISKVLNGYENLSINSIAKIAIAFDAAPHVHLASRNVVVEWSERPYLNDSVDISLRPSNSATHDHVERFGEDFYEEDFYFDLMPGNTSESIVQTLN